MFPDDRKTEGEQPSTNKIFRDAGPLFGSGIQMAAAVVLMFFLGRWLDEKWGTSPWMMMACLMLGAAAGLFQFIRTATDAGKKESTGNKDSGS